MGELQIEFKLAFGMRFDEEAKVHVGFCPTLNLYSQGTTEDEAEQAVVSAATLFIETCYERDILHSFLRERGMTKVSPEKAAPLREEDRQYIKINGYDRVVERSVPIHLLAAAQLGDNACR